MCARPLRAELAETTACALTCRRGFSSGLFRRAQLIRDHHRPSCHRCRRPVQGRSRMPGHCGSGGLSTGRCQGPSRADDQRPELISTVPTGAAGPRGAARSYRACGKRNAVPCSAPHIGPPRPNSIASLETLHGRDTSEVPRYGCSAPRWPAGSPEVPRRQSRHSRPFCERLVREGVCLTPRTICFGIAWTTIRIGFRNAQAGRDRCHGALGTVIRRGPGRPDDTAQLR
jgi:hypothetical protein